jgi:hypothetical protein
MATPNTPAASRLKAKPTMTASHVKPESRLYSLLRRSETVLPNHAISRTSRIPAPQRASSRSSFHHFSFASTTYSTETLLRYTARVVRRLAT